MSKKLFLFLSILMLLTAVLAGCSSDSPSKVVKTYLDAANKGDIDTMIDCLEPKAAALMEGFGDMLGDQFGMDGETLFGMGPGLMSMFNEGGENYSIDYEITDEEIDGDTATVTVEITASAGGESQTQETEIPLIKQDGKWYIAM